MNGKKKILIVDDERINIIALAQFLKPQYEIIVATDGISAMETAGKHKPDIILLDIVMPEMNGFDVLALLKDSTETMNIPVIFITGLSNIEDEERGLSLGAADYIIKPFHKSIVNERIKTQLKMSDYIHTIEKLCMMDVLTGLPNRRGFDVRIGAEWGRAFREKRQLGLIMIDIDNFKKYNDTYGHPQGDALLQTVAEIINKTSNRSTDLAVRWGGEEFLVLLSDTGIEGTLNVAEQIRKNVMDTLVKCADGTITSVTISLGACARIPDNDFLIADYIAEADKYLYISKKNGKNRTSSSASP